jgi:CHASE2 domain-containing sensor protein
MEYENFAIEIGDPVDGRFPLKAHSETMGEAEGVLALSLDSPELASVQQRLGPGNLPLDLLTGFGEQLWNALFAGEIRDLYRECVGRVHPDEDRGLRIRLTIEPPRLSALPWELAYDRNRDTFLATSAKTPLTRYISLHEPIEELTTTLPIKVLVAIPDGSGLDVAQERALVEDALSELGDAVKVTVLEGDVSRAAISRALIEERHNVLHFIGHGRFQQDDGFLVLNRDKGMGEEDLIAARSFAGFFRDYPSMKLVVLNACQGATVAAARPLAGVAPQLVRAGIPAVVAMQYPVSDAAAVLFAREFYLCLCVGANRGRVDAAVSHARNRMQIDFTDTVAFATPVLYMRSPSGVIFDLDAPSRKAGPRMTRAEVHRLKAVKQARKSNIAALEDSAGGDAAAKTAALEHESRQIDRIDRRIRQYYVTIAAVVTASLVLLFASWVGLFNAFKIDDWLERRFLAYMDGFVETPLDNRIALVLASADATQNGALGAPSPDWRCHHAQLVSGLAAARAGVVVFDLHFADPSGCDREFADAIRQAAGAGTAVVLGTEAFELDDGVPRPLMSPVLAEAVEDRWGLVKGRPDARRVQVAAPLTQEVPATIEQREAAVVPSLSLQTVMQHMRRERGGALLAAAVDKGAGVVRVRDASRNELRAIPIVDADLDMIVAVAHSHEVQPTAYHEVVEHAGDPARLSRFKDKIVVIGYGTPDDRWAVSSGDQHYGVELQASAISNILRKVYTQPARPLVQYLVILVMGAVGALLRTRAVRRARLAIPLRGSVRTRRHMEVPWAMLAVVLAYGLVVFFVYKQQRQILDISYHVAALFLVYLLIGWAQKGTLFTRMPKEA